MDLFVRVVIAGLAFGVTSLLVTRWPHVLLARGPVPVAALCVIAAGGALAADSAPTAVGAVNAALRAGLAVAVTAASARARRQAWLFASTAAVVAGTGAAYDWLAFVATGVTFAMLVLSRRSWIVGAFIGGCVTQVLLRLDLRGTTGTSAVVAGAIAGLLVVSGVRRCRRSTRRRVLIGTSAAAAIATVFSGAGALGATRAAGDVRHGINAGQEGLGAARRGEVPAATAAFDRSADAFRGASLDLDRWWVRPALAVPVVGHQLRAVRTLSRAGEDLAGAAATASSELDIRGLRLQHGVIDLAAVDRAAGALGVARHALDRAARHVTSARSPWLVPPVAHAMGELNRRMTEARGDVGTAADALQVAGPMLGRDGPRRWLLAIVTPAENRGSGGLIGNIGEITASAGKVELGGVQRIARLNEAVDDTAAARVLPAIYAEAYGEWKVPAKLQNATVTADFVTAAEALEAVQPLAGRGDVDGAISVDPLAVAALLEVVGPVTVPSWPVPISASNAPSVLLHEQYVALAGDARENFLGEVTAAVWQRAISGDLPSPTSLAKALGPAVRSRHIQFHSRHADEQTALGRLGADGTVRNTGGDHLRLVTDNGSQSKIDWFLRRAVDYHLRYDPASGTAEATVKVILTNEAPASGLPEYVLGGAVAPPGFSRQIVQVYSPLDLLSASVEGRPAAVLRSLGRSGNWAHEFDVAVAPKSTMTIELRLAGRLPGPLDRWTLDVGRQSAVRPDEVTATLELPDGWTVATTTGGLTGRGRTVSARLDLDRDARIAAEIRRR